MEQTKGLKRNTKDKYYTKHDIIIEPIAGNGSFIEGIKKLSKNYLLYDINKYHAIGNPPFGRQSGIDWKVQSDVISKLKY